MLPTAPNLMSSSKSHRHGRSTSIDVSSGETRDLSRSFRQAFGKLKLPLPNSEKAFFNDGAASLTPKHEAELVWRERRRSSLVGKPPPALRTKRLVGVGVALFVCCIVLMIAGRLSRSHATRSSALSGPCNPYAMGGTFHSDFSEPSNNYWQPVDRTCQAPRYIAKLRDRDYGGMDWIRNRTVLLIGDSIERDHVSLFCTLLGAEAVVARGRHPLAPEADTGVVAGAQKKSRASRIAYKGMQESTLPRVCHIEDLNFMMVNAYHFGLDEQEFWKNIDQFRGTGSIEERLDSEILPLVKKIRSDGRQSAPDLVEIGSGMFDLARWARQDIEAQRSTEEPLTVERIGWYASRMNKFMDATAQAFPKATKLWRAVTMPDDQSAELDYFHDRFGRSDKDVPAHFSPNRVQQLDEIARGLVKPFQPRSPKSAKGSQSKRRASSPAAVVGSANSETAASASLNIVPRTPSKALKGKDFAYNSWSSLVKGVPAHQLDRLHGGDLATPGVVLWSDMILWHLEQGLQQSS